MNVEQIAEVTACANELRAASVELELHKIAVLREQKVRLDNYTLAKNKMKKAEGCSPSSSNSVPD